MVRGGKFNLRLLIKQVLILVSPTIYWMTWLRNFAGVGCGGGGGSSGWSTMLRYEAKLSCKLITLVRVGLV